MNCCDDFGGCRQDPNCPARAGGLITDNSDGSSTGHPADDLIDDTGLLICQGLALMLFAVSVGFFIFH